MAVRDIDSYLAGVGEPKRSTLQQLRQCVLDVIPEAEECISYGLPAFKVQGKTVRPAKPRAAAKKRPAAAKKRSGR